VYCSKKCAIATAQTNLLRTVTSSACASATSSVSQKNADCKSAQLAKSAAQAKAIEEARLVNIATDYVFYVSNLNDSGNGSLREAINLGNKAKGPKIYIQFLVAGTIVIQSSLPKFENTIKILGSSAPNWSYLGRPVVKIDCNGYNGLEIKQIVSECEIDGLEIINSLTSGIVILGKNNIVYNCYIHDNKEHGIAIGVLSQGNIIGRVKTNLENGNKIPSNVITNNGQSGIVINFASNNSIQNNYIGVDYTGNNAHGNKANGIYILNNSSNNAIGGPLYTNVVTGEANDPTGDKGTVTPVFVIPNLGNVISGNGLYGITIQNSRDISVMGNFVGTNYNGSIAIPNNGSGIYISNCNYIYIYGCSINDNPFVYYNVISGNNGHGIEIVYTNYVFIRGNFIGINAYNNNVIPNKFNGIKVGRSTSNIIVGGVIPLGNVISGNKKNGIYVTETASSFETYNTFGGLFAFGQAAPNGENGILIDSNVKNVTIGNGADARTNVFSGNTKNGIKVAGSSNNVVIEALIAGLDTKGSSILPNGENGIFITENSTEILIGNKIESIIYKSVISGNKKNGIFIENNSDGNIVTNCIIGLNVVESGDGLGNGKDGILIKSNANKVTNLKYPNVICSNNGHGIRILGKDNIITQNYVGINTVGVKYPNKLQPEILGNPKTNIIKDNYTP
jgi:hypothetical protein